MSAAILVRRATASPIRQCLKWWTRSKTRFGLVKVISDLDWDLRPAESNVIGGRRQVITDPELRRTMSGSRPPSLPSTS
jgi:hypothetical protein